MSPQPRTDQRPMVRRRGLLPAALSAVAVVALASVGAQAADEKAERIDVEDIDRLLEATGTKSISPAAATTEIEEFPDY